jgi:hypothetical protein
LAAATSTLSFDADQKAAAKTLYEGYRASFKELTKKMQDVKHTPRDDGPQRPPEGWPKKVEEYTEQVQLLERRLLDDLRAICTPAQAGKFAAVERAQRRREGFRLALAAGEGIDILEVLGAIKVEPGSVPGLGEVLARWETDVDRSMVEKDKYMRANFSKLVGAGEQADTAKKNRQDFIGELFRISGQVRDINRRAVREIEPLLPEASRESFQKQVNTRTFPRIYGPSKVDALIDECLRLGDITAEQRAALDQLRQAYAKEAAPINTRFAAGAEEKQSKLATDIESVMMGGEDPKDAYWAAAKERHDLDDRTAEKARAILTKEQVQRLPHPPQSHEIPEFLPDIDGFEKEWEEFSGEESGG